MFSFRPRTWVANLFPSVRTRSSAKKRLRTRPLQVEALEGRVTPATFTVNVTTDAGSFMTGIGSGTTGDLRYAIAQADANPGSTIVFNLPANSTITVRQALEPIYANMTINGATATNLTISGGGTSRIFFVMAGTVTVEGLTIANGVAQGAPAVMAILSRLPPMPAVAAWPIAIAAGAFGHAVGTVSSSTNAITKEDVRDVPPPRI